ncbi:hypothetical protein F4U02_04690 [Acinetobacter haemolyticus]|uniref:hypothetical protein n=1 Tax=Acinetobacter haemolyticus TaxID=29430 RepID=UPI000F757C1C|nr:hypothetical protein [Acinetobacter haemolyticus]AZN68664.1 hypothetical protein DX910_10860 [Acinetobacter haemolyticus]MQZ30304.1 hypothetical protein [Acinetobacter haemolyticus]
MKSHFIREGMRILHACQELGLDLGYCVDYPDHFLVTLPNGLDLLVPAKRWIVVEGQFVSIMTDEEYKARFGTVTDTKS